MIQLTRLNHSRVMINSDLIKFVEQSPDTVITLLNGEKILVQETVPQIIQQVIEFRRHLLAGASPGGGPGALAAAAEPTSREITNEGR
jgi:flagellar protein FlbD